MSRRKAAATRSKPRPRPSIVDALTAVPVIAAGALFVAVALLSLGWAVEHDAPCMAYAGFLIGHQHWMPYRDLFDVNLPGTYFIFAALDGVFGPSDLGFRFADLTFLVVLSWLTWKRLRPFGWMPAVVGPTLFGLFYLHDGPTLCLQREFLMLPLFGLAILFTTGFARLGPARRALGLGACVGLAALIKPQALLILPVCLVFLLTERSIGAEAAEPSAVDRGRWLRILALCAAGAAVPILGTVAWLAAAGALDDYVGMARDYYPLYSRLSGIHQTLSEDERRHYVMEGWRLLGGLHLWLLPAGLGAWIGGFRGAPPSRRRVVWLLVALAATTSVFPPIAGQFFPYHWIPFFFFMAVLSSLCLSSPTPGLPVLLRGGAAAVLVAVAVTQITFAREIDRQLAGLPLERHLGHRIDTIADYLRGHLRPGDTVQPLDWTGGSIDAMWRARAPLATRFMADFYFYHHVSTPYIQSLRRRFMDEMRRARPRVVIDIRTLKPWVGGEDTTREFPELQRFLQEHYTEDLVEPGFAIYLRRDG